MPDLTAEIVEIALSNEAVAARRSLIGERLLRLLDADRFVSYVCDATGPYADPVGVNHGPELVSAYQQHFRRVDTVTPEMFGRRRASIMTPKLDSRDEFVHDFLHRSDMYSGMNYFPARPGVGSLDLRVWRGRRRPPFGADDVRLLQTVGDLLDRVLPRQTPSTLPGLTAREREIADLVVAGCSDKEICATLAISAPTLRTHISHLFAKTGTRNRAGLAAFHVTHHQK